MINRVLIRIKVVQLLYSYLLTHQEFKLHQAPDSPSRDKQYAYKLYMELIIMLARLGGYKLSSNIDIPEIGFNKYLKSNAIISELQGNTLIREYASQHLEAIKRYSGVLPEIEKAIVNSTVYKSYVRNKQITIADEAHLISYIVRTIFAKNKSFISVCSEDPDYTVVGYDNAIRLATNTVDSFGFSRNAYIEAKNALTRSLDKSYELYHALLLLPVEMTRLQEQRIENAKMKFLPTDEDLNPNTKFIDNLLVKKLENCEDLNTYLKSNPISWFDNPTLIRSLLDKVLESDIYAEYMNSSEQTLSSDCDFWRQIFKKLILPSDILAEALEVQSVYWNDDLDIIGTFVLKTFKKLSAEDCMSLLPKFKDEEDARFGTDLFVDCVKNYDLYRSYIDRFINAGHWDPERLAFMDVIIMVVAISELLNYEAIPIPVTLNEYIEIANSYSTPKSGQFINGILFSVINFLKSEGKLLKN